MEAYIPQRINTFSTEMICPECEYASHLYFVYCPSCNAPLDLRILKRFRKFKQSYMEITDQKLLDEVFSQELLNKASSFVSGSEKGKIIALLQEYFVYYYSRFFLDLYSLYSRSFRILLKKDYLHEFQEELMTHLKFLKGQIKFYRSQREQYSHIRKQFYLFRIEKTFIFLSKILRQFSHQIAQRDNIEESEIIINYLVLSAINELIRLLRAQILCDSNTKDSQMLELKQWLLNFSMSEDDYIRISPIFIKFLESEQIQTQLYQLRLELFYLPQNNAHMVVKSTYTPDLAQIENLSTELGGVTCYSIMKNLQYSSMEAELFIQIIVRRRLGVSTFSYLHGLRLYLRNQNQEVYDQ